MPRRRGRRSRVAGAGRRRAHPSVVVLTTAVDRWLAEQQHVTPVDKLAATPGMTTAWAPRALVPDSLPGPGQQYRFEVDLDTCTGCKACVVACHTMNGLHPVQVSR